MIVTVKTTASSLQEKEAINFRGHARRQSLNFDDWHITKKGR